MKTLKKAAALFITVIVLLSVFGVLTAGTSAALNGVYFAKNDRDNWEGGRLGTPGSIIYLNEETWVRYEGAEGERIADGRQYIVYRIPLETKAKVDAAGGKAVLVMTISRDYHIHIAGSTKNNEPVKNQSDGTFAPLFLGSNVIELDNPQKQSEHDRKFNIKPFIDRGERFLYVRFADKTTSDGAGGSLHRIFVAYYDFPIFDRSLETQFKSFNFVPTGNLEYKYLVSGGGQTKEFDNFRFMDGLDEVIYRIPYNDRRDATLVMNVDNRDCLVQIAGGSYDESKPPSDSVPRRSEFMDIYRMPPESEITMHPYPRTFYYDLRDFRGSGDSYLYVRIGDYIPTNGWGGILNSLGFIVDTDYSKLLYLPYKIDGIRVSRPPTLRIYRPYPKPVVKEPSSDSSEGQGEEYTDDVEETDDNFDEPYIEEIEGEFADFGVVAGNLKDQYGQPLAGATLILRSEPKETVTEDEGWFIFPDVEPGEHQMSILDVDTGDEITAEHVLNLAQGEEKMVEAVFDGENKTLTVTEINEEPDPEPEDESEPESSEEPSSEEEVSSEPQNNNPAGMIIAIIIIAVVVIGGGIAAFLLIQKNKTGKEDGGSGSEGPKQE
ncbi:MAG: carboxypeptidase-like regulatory domain-containing protein [Oscillospiraceae bacterium]|nr:carboxypeptidase-like regulatory domain-containing protein [Oscillospiraceae bacterium]